MAQSNSNLIPSKDYLKIISWNVKGLNQAIKSKRVFSHFQHLRVGIAFLQETHLQKRDQTKIHRELVGQLFHSQFNSKGRGVAILIHKNIPFVVSDTILDPNGRYVIVVGQLFQLSLVLVNIYGPNFDYENIFKKLFSCIPSLDSHHLIMAGDYNLVINSVLDRSSESVHRPSKSLHTVQSFIDTHKLIDPWRFEYPIKREYSYYPNVHKSFSRIDFFLVDPYLLSDIIECEDDTIIISDHAPVSIKMTLPTQRTKRTW
uniref:exodeoxyribonuclease III n=1 Tax=Nothobranchius furzeri TaxID=105023 RepID=A0A1A8A3J2_NOTFU